jgi:CDP-diacylglycerol--glycerol-3-phosphate 3-phosphatidyltransferase
MLKHVPNILTVLRMILTPIFIYSVLSSHLQIYAIAIFFVASISDWFDGYLARKYSLTSEWGRFWDPLADKILILSALFSFSYLGLIQLWMVIVILIRDCIVTGLRSYSLIKGKPMMTNIFAKMKTATQLAMIGFILIFIVFQSLMVELGNEFNSYIANTVDLITTYNIIYGGMFFVTMITIFSGLFYLYQNWSAIRQFSIFSHLKNFL